MVKYNLYKQKGARECLGEFNSKHEAFEWMIKYINKHNKSLNPGDENILTSFDFGLKAVECL